MAEAVTRRGQLTASRRSFTVCHRRSNPVSTPGRPWPTASTTFMAGHWLASLSMAPFDFSAWTTDSKADAKPRFHDLGLTAEQVESILTSKAGISRLLIQEFDRETMRGGVPHSFMKALIVFEEYGRDTSYGAIAAALDVNKETAKEYLREARVALRTALGIEIIADGDNVRLVAANDARERAERVVNVFNQQVMPALKKLEACATSLAKSNAPVQLSPQVQALLLAAGTEEAA